MVPETFYLPTNGVRAITNLLVSRPYVHYDRLLGKYITIDGDSTKHDTPMEYSIDNFTGSKVLTANGLEVYQPIQKTFTVIKNQ